MARLFRYRWCVVWCSRLGVWSVQTDQPNLCLVGLDRLTRLFESAGDVWPTTYMVPVFVKVFVEVMCTKVFVSIYGKMRVFVFVCCSEFDEWCVCVQNQ